MTNATVFDPSGRPVMTGYHLAARPATLAGGTIGILDNSKPNAGVLMERIAELLENRYPGLRVVRVRKQAAGTPANAAQLEALSQCDIVLTGSAD